MNKGKSLTPVFILKELQNLHTIHILSRNKILNFLTQFTDKPFHLKSAICIS